jgi:hypothetical protein
MGSIQSRLNEEEVKEGLRGSPISFKQSIVYDVIFLLFLIVGYFFINPQLIITNTIGYIRINHITD